MKHLFWLGLAFLCLCGGRASAQTSARDSSVTMFLINASYGGYAPQADFGKRFGFTSLLGGDVGVKFASGVYLMVGCNFLFCEKMRETNTMDNVGFVNYLPPSEDGRQLINGGWIDKDGDVVHPVVKGRGFNVPLRVGYIFNKLRLPFNNPNAGVFVEAVGSFVQHKIVYSSFNDVPYLSGEVAKGYDRLTQGWGVGGSIGYRYFSGVGFFNFYVAFDYLQYFGHNLRYNYNTQSPDDRTRQDIMMGGRIGFSIPIYRQAPEKSYYY